MLICYEIKFFHILCIWKENKRKLQIVYLVASNKIGFFDQNKIRIIQWLNLANIEIKQAHIKDHKDKFGTAIQFNLLEKCRKLSLQNAQDEIKRAKLGRILARDVIADFQIILAQDSFYEILDALRKSELANNVYKDRDYVLMLCMDKRYREIINPEILGRVRYLGKPKVNLLFFSQIIVASLGPIMMFCKVFLSVEPVGNSNLDTISTSYSGYESERIDIRNSKSWFIRLKGSEFKLVLINRFKIKNLFDSNHNSIQSKITNVNLNKPYLSKTKIFNSSFSDVLAAMSGIFRLDKKIFAMRQKIRIFSLVCRYIWEIESKLHLLRKYRCRVFVYEDDYFLSHVMNSLSKLGYIDTIKLQYSNMGMKSLFMLSNPNKMLIFSDSFKPYFSDDEFDLGPKTYIESGYPLNIDSISLTKRSESLRSSLLLNGAEFVVGVFDESVQSDHDLWAWKTKSEHLIELETLCKFILANEDVGVIFKTQFVRNNPLKLFPDNKLIVDALSTNRMIFPSVGNKRNLILPGEIAKAADICIGDIVGGTASLEAALSGTKSILIDSMNFGPRNRKIYYDNKGIVFKDLESGLSAITEYRSRADQNNDIGNWSRILSELRITNRNMQDKINEEIESVFFG
jgi:hypothetical protein